MPDETRAIEFWPCGYQAPCQVRNCQLKATTIARSVDASGRPMKQYELCQAHTDQVTARELAKGRQGIERRIPAMPC
jgi:hypothetical protein